jgi:hypothetical protein
MSVPLPRYLGAQSLQLANGSFIMADPHVRRGSQHTNGPNLCGPDHWHPRATRRKRYAPVVGAYAHTFRLRYETREVLTVADNPMCDPLHCPLASANGQSHVSRPGPSFARWALGSHSLTAWSSLPCVWYCSGLGTWGLRPAQIGFCLFACS